jgi:hypothetical protein
VALVPCQHASARVVVTLEIVEVTEVFAAVPTDAV